MKNGLTPKGRFGLVEPPRGADKPCTYCRRIMVAWTDTHPTQDHIIPVSRGGRTTVLCCHQCNQMKRDMMPDEWNAFMRANPCWWALGTKFKADAQPNRFHTVCPAMLACSNALFEERYKHRGVFRSRP